MLLVLLSAIGGSLCIYFPQEDPLCRKYTLAWATKGQFDPCQYPIIFTNMLIITWFCSLQIFWIWLLTWDTSQSLDILVLCNTQPVCSHYCVVHKPTLNPSLLYKLQIEIVHKNQAPMLMGPLQGRSFFSSVIRRTRTESKDWCTTVHDLQVLTKHLQSSSGHKLTIIWRVGKGAPWCLFDTQRTVANCRFKYVSPAAWRCHLRRPEECVVV